MSETVTKPTRKATWRFDNYANNLGWEAFYKFHKGGQCLIYKAYWETGAAWREGLPVEIPPTSEPFNFICEHCGHRARWIIVPEARAGEVSDARSVDVNQFTPYDGEWDVRCVPLKQTWSTVAEEQKYWGSLRERRAGGYAQVIAAKSNNAPQVLPKVEVATKPVQPVLPSLPAASSAPVRSSQVTDEQAAEIATNPLLD